MRKAVLFYLLIIFSVIGMTACGRSQENSVPSASGEEESLSVEHRQEEELNQTKTAPVNTEAQTREAVLTLEEKELTIEEEQFFYGALKVGLPEGVSVQGQESPTNGQTIDFYGLENYEEYPNQIEPRIWLSFYQAEYENKEALMVALLKLTGGTGTFLFCDEKNREFTCRIVNASSKYYIFIREQEAYVVECLDGEEDYAFPWLLREQKTVGWADSEKQAAYDENYDSLAYLFFSLKEGEDYLITYDAFTEETNETRLYLRGFYDAPLQVIQNEGFPSENKRRDWNFDGCTDLVFPEKIYLWSEKENQFVAAKTKMNLDDLWEAEVWPETKTIWLGDFEFGEDYFDVIETEALWQWEGNELVKQRECRERKAEDEIHLLVYGKIEDEILFEESLSVKDKNLNEKILDFYERFYEGLVPDKFYSLKHSGGSGKQYIPKELVELLTKAIQEGRELEVLSPLMNDRELSKEEVLAFVRENRAARLSFADRMPSASYCMLEADLDNDGIKDILAQIHSGGSAGFVDFVFYQGQGDGTYEETDSFTSFQQEFGIISFEGKNYLCRTEFDYVKKLYSGLSAFYYEEGKVTEELYLNLEADSYDMQVVECAEPKYEIFADEMVQKGPFYKEKIEDYTTIVGNAENSREDDKIYYFCDLDNDGIVEVYKKYIWTTSTISTRDSLGFEGEENEEGSVDEGIRLLEETIWADTATGWPIMFWVDTYESENIIHVVYITGLYDFEIVGYLMKESTISQIYRVQGDADWYVDCVRTECF